MSRYGERTRIGEAVSNFGQRPSETITDIVVEYVVIAGGGVVRLALAGWS
jgi:hypothetical protein